MTTEEWGLLLALAVMAMAIRLSGLYAGRYLAKHRFSQSMVNAVPGCLLIALVVPDLISRGVGGWAAAGATLLLMMKTRNITIGMLGGVLVMALARLTGLVA